VLKTLQGLLQGFKNFILRGNVVDLSVGIVIGAAFTALVESFTAAFINPLLQLFGATEERPGGGFHIGSVLFPVNTFVNGVITFLLTAAVLYFLVVTPMNKLAKLRNKGAEPESEAPSEEVLLLREIRDALRANAGAVPASRRPDDAN